MKKLINSVTRKLRHHTMISFGWRNKFWFLLYDLAYSIDRCVNPSEFKLSVREMKALAKEMAVYLQDTGHLSVDDSTAQAKNYPEVGQRLCGFKETVRK